MNAPLPPSLNYYRDYFEAERIEWDQTVLGQSVLVETKDLATNASGSFGFQIIDKERLPNGLSNVWVELEENGYIFTKDTQDRSRLKLPQGTLMKAGISCVHFPRTDTTMTYLGGIRVNQDFSFEDVQIPDGRRIGSIVVPKITALYSFLPEDKPFNPPAGYAEYRRSVNDETALYEQELGAWAERLDAQIGEFLQEHFPESPKDIESIQEIFSTFHPEGRHKLALIMELSLREETLKDFLAILQDALKEEFSYAPPVVLRGLGIVPADQRGWDMMIRGLKLEKYAK